MMISDAGATRDFMLALSMVLHTDGHDNSKLYDVNLLAHGRERNNIHIG